MNEETKTAITCLVDGAIISIQELIDRFNKDEKVMAVDAFKDLVRFTHSVGVLGPLIGENEDRVSRVTVLALDCIEAAYIRAGAIESEEE